MDVPSRVTARFAELASGPDDEFRLDEAALLVAASAHPGLDVGHELARLDGLAAGCAAPTLDALLQHLFVELGFTGNREDYYDPRNSFLNDVLDRRTGLPITLAVLAMEVGRRIGVPLAGVGLPGHFLLRDRVDPDLFVDPFHRGRLLDRDGVEARFREVQGADAPFDPAFLEPVPRKAIVARMLANLKGVYAEQGSARDLAWVLRLRSELPGVDATERRQLARVLAGLGRFDEAADALDPLGAAHAGEALRLRARLN